MSHARDMFPSFFINHNPVNLSCFPLQACVPVEIMPGEFDPANHTMPQQPLHRCMFPQAAAYSTFQSVTNPYEAVIGGVRY